MHVASTSVVGLDFDAFNASCQANFDAAIAKDGPRLFTTDVEDLFETYLDNLDPGERQHHNCNCCKRFILRYGGLVTINEDGALRSAIWDAETAPEGYENAARALSRAVKTFGKVTGVFRSSELVWGVPEDGGFTHFALKPSAVVERVKRHDVYNAHQQMAMKREDYRTLKHGLAEFTPEIVTGAVHLLESDALYRSEKVLGPAKFLSALHTAIEGARGKLRDNLIWRAVASAPVGFCTPRSSMVGTLLEDLAAGMSVDTVRKRFKSKMDPLQYQRPQAAPKAGNIAQAEKLVEQMGIEPALHRRWARIDEVKLLWSPPAPKNAPPTGGVFGHLHSKGRAVATTMSSPNQAMTWSKFLRTVLPNALKIEAKLTSRMAFTGTLTATNADAPPILQWDDENDRNPFSQYVYARGSTPFEWGLSGEWVNVPGVMFHPSMWSGEDAFPHQGKRVTFILEGAEDKRCNSLCLFPENLKSALHPVRSTIEAYSSSRSPSGAEQGTANGLAFSDKSPLRIRVTTASGVSDITLDRWE